MSALEILLVTKNILVDPGIWRQGTYVLPRVGGMDCFCLVGALYKAAGATDIAISQAARQRICIEEGLPAAIGILECLIGVGDEHDWESVEEWNDAKGREHAEVMAVLDKAIERAGETA
jgi:hypothetical protein